ncbi:MAG: DUF465 domain-containing protein [Brachymonas sp.]|nr:DUF465 domain-containing protein [Brachymonas sp.]
MFPEHRELMDKLKAEDPRFERLLAQHAELDEKIRKLEIHANPVNVDDIDAMKKQKLTIKDEVYKHLSKASEKP